jgi:hypothetical protein
MWKMKFSGIILRISLIFLFYGIMITHLDAGNWHSAPALQDSTQYQSFQGKIVETGTGNPVIFASVYLVGTNIGTVSNSEGYFLIKVPMFLENKIIGFSSIGYKNVEIPVEWLNPEGTRIELEPNPIPIEEVTIINKDARELLIMALQSISRNYSTDPVMMTSFYREAIKQNRSFVSVSEAVLDGYKSSYTSLADLDRVKIFKGRKSQDVKKMDTVLFKLQGGPQTMFMLDIVKNPGELFDNEAMTYYTYQMGGIINIDDEQAYVITFDQLDFVNFPLYSGKVYISIEELAIVGIEFQISEKKRDMATQYLIRKKPAGMRIKLDNASYLVNYRLINGKWHLYYVRTELMFSVRWSKKLFRSRYTTLSEMAVTDIDTENITKYKFRETTKRSDIFAEQVGNFEDPDFWGDYNIIQPEESIQTAIERIGRKLRRRER